MKHTQETLGSPVWPEHWAQAGAWEKAREAALGHTMESLYYPTEALGYPMGRREQFQLEKPNYDPSADDFGCAYKYHE